MLSTLVRPARVPKLAARQASRPLAIAPHSRPTSPLLPYQVRRNSRGSIPVYTDIRNGRTRYQVLIRNVEGNIDALADDLTRTLFPAGSIEAERVGVETLHQKHIILTGGRWKNDVLHWLVQKGF